MPRTVSATEAKNRLGAIVEYAVKNPDGVIIESRGKPRAVILSFEEYQKVKKVQEQARRREALEKLRALAEEVRQQNQDLSADQADELADQIVREAIVNMIRQGKVRYAGSV